MTDTLLLGVTDAAYRLNCSAQRVRQLADEGVLPVMRMSRGQRIFRQEDVEKLARERAAMKASAATVGDASELKTTS
jgi:excisionase family DNA binding protein